MAKHRENGIKEQSRQGDVLLQKLNKPVQELGKVAPARRGVVLSEGETRGHAHVLDPEAVYEFSVEPALAELGHRFFQAVKDTDLTHETHEPIPVTVGDQYLSIQQVEYKPESKPRPVRD